MKIERKKITQLDIDEIKSIDKLILDHYGLIFHEIEFNQILANVFSTDFSCMLASEDGTIMGFCPLHRLKSGILGQVYSNPRIYEAVYGGWIFNSQMTNEQDLIRNLTLARNESLTYWSNIRFGMDVHPEGKQISSIKNFSTHYTAIVDLNNSQEFLWTSIVNQKRRNMIKKALKNDINIKHYGPEGLDIYYPLMIETNEAVGVQVKPYKYYLKVLSRYCDDKKSIIIIAEYQNEPIAGVLLLGNKNVMHYWQGASKRNNPNLGQGDLLQWEAIKWAKENGCHYYDLCSVEADRLPQIAKFKMGFSKDLVPFYYLSKRSLYYKIVSRIYHAIKVA